MCKGFDKTKRMGENAEPGRLRKAAAWRKHERRWRDNRYVYAVISRRSKGISVGINLNPSKACNFDCIYCQVNRREPPAIRGVDLEVLAAELDFVLRAEREGSLYEAPPFQFLTPAERGIRDIAFSGDGEPTTFRRFADAVAMAAEARKRYGLEQARLILITDAAYLQKENVRIGLALLDQNNGEIWAKLDAGTEEYFRLVNRPNVPFAAVLENILAAARVRPLVIQSLWMRIRGCPPSEAELEAYCARLKEILHNGGQLKALQEYTIARDPAESFVEGLSDSELDAIAALVRSRVPIPVEAYYGV
jgi:wyosine [tRNA(Phe)-imidazoG37] synthetase (radical SAM superfamily)